MAEKRNNRNNKQYGTIIDKGNGKYIVTFDFGMVDGKRERQSKQFSDLDEAEDALKEHGRQMRDKKANPKRFTIEDMIAEWKTNGKNKNNWAITTMYGYDKILDNHFRPFLDSVKLIYPEQVTPVIINSYLDMLKEKKELDNNSIIKHYDVLNAIFNFALELGRVKENPVLRRLKPKKIKRKQKKYTLEEEVKLMEAAELANEKVIIDIFVFFGERRSEVIGAQWGDIDFENGILRVERGRTRAGGEDDWSHTKSDNSMRSLKLQQRMLDDLIKERARQAEFKALLGKRLLDSDFVVVSQVCEPYHPSSINGIVVKLCMKAGVENKGTHAFRRIFATTAYQVTKDIKSVAKTIGDDVRTAGEIYVLLEDDANEETVEAFADYYDKVEEKLNGNKENMEDKGRYYKEKNVLRLK